MDPPLPAPHSSLFTSGLYASPRPDSRFFIRHDTTRAIWVVIDRNIDLIIAEALTAGVANRVAVALGDAHREITGQK